MTQLVWHAFHEEIPPADLVELAVLVERAGFDGLHSSDHLAPWFPDGESGHAWTPGWVRRWRAHRSPSAW